VQRKNLKKYLPLTRGGGGGGAGAPGRASDAHFSSRHFFLAVSPITACVNRRSTFISCVSHANKKHSQRPELQVAMTR
jgi:hypothetical protein